jgi:CRISPR-associated protein Cmr4
MPSDHLSGNVLYLQAITSLHPGSGTALGAIDLPVQRERHTGWPTIPGSSLKGVFRDAALRSNSGEVETLFGKAREGQDDGGFAAGVLSFTDARLLAFPVRSLYGVFALVTCPTALKRWQRDAALVGKKITLPEANPKEGQACAVAGCRCISPSKKLVLEEFSFSCHEMAKAIPAPPIGSLDPARIVVVHDDDFTHFAQHATEVTARIGLDSTTKTVKDGALFYEEFLPAETLLYSLVLRSARGNGVEWTPPAFAQIGGDETIGKGLCAVVQS